MAKTRAEKAAHMRQYRHGLNLMKRAVTKYGSRAIDGRSKLAYALKAWQRDLIADLGGDDNISTQQRTIVELAAVSKLLLNSIDAWLLERPSLFQRGDRALLPVVIQRQQLADGLARYMNQLGLERRAKVRTLQEILSQEPADSGKEEP